MAPRRKPIDEKRVIELASKGYLLKEIAALENVSHDTLARRCAKTCEIGKDLLRGQLRAKQVEVAMGGIEYTNSKGQTAQTAPNPLMLIWLGKQLLDQADKREDTLDVRRSTTIRMVGIAPEELEALASHQPQIEYSEAEIVDQEEPAKEAIDQ